MLFSNPLSPVDRSQAALLILLPGLIGLSGNSLSPFTIITFLVAIAVGLGVLIHGQRSGLNNPTGTRLQNDVDKLKQMLQEREQEIKNMRESLAADFHDETGSLLSVIIHQANILKLSAPDDLQPVVSNILNSSLQLSTSSRDFLWYVQCDRQDPETLLKYLTDFGQSYFSKFDIDFSAENNALVTTRFEKLRPSSIINLVFIFKEAMTNVVKHSRAREVKLSMNSNQHTIIYSLIDDGCWKEKDATSLQHGLQNIARRSEKSDFRFMLTTGKASTRVDIEVPLTN